jgi:hypothetical protein
VRSMDAVTAKQFLISKVLWEADSSHVQISEVERKMLYFTEVHPSLADIREVHAEFERDYDADEYENKVAQLLKNARARDTNISPSQEHDWNEALDALTKEDHYLLVMVGLAFGYGASSGNALRVRHLLIYISIGIALVLFLVLTTFWRATH